MTKRIRMNKVAISFLLCMTVLLAALPVAAEEVPELAKMFDNYLARQEKAEEIAQIEANKDAFVQDLAAKWEAAALDNGNNDNWYERAVDFMSNEDAETLWQMSEATTFDELFFGTQTDSELVFYPLTPCRIVDTRYATRWGSQTPIPAGGTITLQTWGSRIDQGGVNLNTCGTKNSAAVVINVTSVPVSGSGHLRVWEYNSTMPNASLVNYKTGIMPAIANAVVQSQCYGCSDELNVYSSAVSHVIIDVIGYFDQPSATPVQSVIQSNSESLPAGAKKEVDAVCPTGYRITGGGCHVDHWIDVILSGSRPWGNGWRCECENISGSATGLNTHAVCSRIPGQ